MSCNENFGLSGAVAGLELLRESSAGILPAVASASRASGRARRPPDSRRDGGARSRAPHAERLESKAE